jgi:hypothetical protein
MDLDSFPDLRGPFPFRLPGFRPYRPSRVHCPRFSPKSCQAASDLRPVLKSGADRQTPGEPLPAWHPGRVCQSVEQLPIWAKVTREKTAASAAIQGQHRPQVHHYLAARTVWWSKSLLVAPGPRDRGGAKASAPGFGGLFVCGVARAGIHWPSWKKKSPPPFLVYRDSPRSCPRLRASPAPAVWFAGWARSWRWPWWSAR